MTPRAGAGRLVVVRHGQTPWNAAGRYQGHADVELDDEGRAQAGALARALAGLAADRIATSDLRRARATAEALAGVLGLEPVPDARLREVDVGAWEGLTAEQAAGRFPEEYAAWRAGEDVARGAGETRADAGRRAAAAIREHVALVPDGGTLVVVSHGMVLREALRRLRSEGLVDLDEDPPHLGNAAWLDARVARCCAHR